MLLPLGAGLNSSSAQTAALCSRAVKRWDVYAVGATGIKECPCGTEILSFADCQAAASAFVGAFPETLTPPLGGSVWQEQTAPGCQMRNGAEFQFNTCSQGEAHSADAPVCRVGITPGLDGLNCTGLEKGSVCLPLCASGYLVDVGGGSTPLTCREVNGPAMCDFAGSPACVPMSSAMELRCLESPPLEPPVRAATSCTPLFHGERCQVSCPDGYDLDGGQSLLCQLGTFVADAGQPACVPKSCREPPVIMNAEDMSNCAGMSHGDSCTPSCSEGYNFFGGQATPVRCTWGRFDETNASCRKEGLAEDVQFVEAGALRLQLDVVVPSAGGQDAGARFGRSWAAANKDVITEAVAQSIDQDPALVRVEISGLAAGRLRRRLQSQESSFRLTISVLRPQGHSGGATSAEVVGGVFGPLAAAQLSAPMEVLLNFSLPGVNSTYLATRPAQFSVAVRAAVAFHLPSAVAADVVAELPTSAGVAACFVRPSSNSEADALEVQRVLAASAAELAASLVAAMRANGFQPAFEDQNISAEVVGAPVVRGGPSSFSWATAPGEGFMNVLASRLQAHGRAEPQGLAEAVLVGSDPGSEVASIMIPLPEWSVGAWGQCDADCGKGFLNRSVECSDDVESACSGAASVLFGGDPNKPAEQLPCESYSRCSFNPLCPLQHQQVRELHDGSPCTTQASASLGSLVLICCFCCCCSCVAWRKAWRWHRRPKPPPEPTPSMADTEEECRSRESSERTVIVEDAGVSAPRFLGFGLDACLYPASAPASPSKASGGVHERIDSVEEGPDSAMSCTRCKLGIAQCTPASCWSV